MKAKTWLLIAAVIFLILGLGLSLYQNFHEVLYHGGSLQQMIILFLGFACIALLILTGFLLVFFLRERSKLTKMAEQTTKLDKLASIGFLTSGIAHEINNPVNFVSSNITSLTRNFQDIISVLDRYSIVQPGPSVEQELSAIQEYKNEIDLSYTLDETSKLLKGIQEGAQRTSEIVKDLRNFSRSDEGEMRSANIEEGIDSTLNLLYNQVKNRIKIIKEYGSIPEINCHLGKLNQVFMNVLVNAVHAIHDKGEIRIKTERLNGQVVIKIKDTGSGIKKEHLPFIFDPFFTTKGAGEGTGLGLTLSRSIISEHHGNIEVSSQEGKGTEFVISLPMLSDQEKEPLNAATLL